ncbi:MAG: TaqI-like C-terminal specificity domain-containing protein, partial [Bacteroidales bacterium]|nr:TaqI-like C-terminal specificity domain-containing protein [Bacteroidales bacterium]
WDIHINYGIKTGFNDAFIISGEKRRELIEADPKSEEIIRPILRGRDIKRYSYDFDDLWLINTHNAIKEKGIQAININDYPAIKKHLDAFYPELVKRADKGNTPYNLRNCAYMEDFYRQKIIFQEMVQEPSFTFDKDGIFFCLDTGRIIVGDDIDFLITIFNSKLFFFAVKKFYGGGGLGESGVRMKHTFFEQFHCPIPSNEEKERFIFLTNKITKEDAYKTENEIDKSVYQLYKLSDEEIEFIERL